MPQTLDIQGFGGEPVPNTFIRHDAETSHVSIVLPGFAYPAVLPGLHYPSHLLLTMGADLLAVNYDYSRPELADISRDERRARLTEDTTAACNAALAQRDYDRITLIGKSLGTMAMVHLLVTDPRLAAAECVWLTPLLREDLLRSAIVRCRNRSLFVIGSADAHYDPALIDEVTEATGGRCLLLEGANHGLNVEGDVAASVRGMEKIVIAMERFLG